MTKIEDKSQVYSKVITDLSYYKKELKGKKNPHERRIRFLSYIYALCQTSGEVRNMAAKSKAFGIPTFFIEAMLNHKIMSFTLEQPAGNRTKGKKVFKWLSKKPSKNLVALIYETEKTIQADYVLDRKKPEDKQRNFGEIVIDDLNRIKGVNKEILTLLLSPEKYAQQFKRLHASNETFYELLNGIGTKEQNGIVLGNAKREILAIIQKCVIDNSEAIKKRLDNIPIAGSEKSNNVINALEIRTTKNHEQLLAIYVRIESRFKFLANLMEVLIANNDTGKTLRVPKKADETLFDFMNNKDINEKHFKSLHESNKANYVMLESLEKILKEYSPSGEMPHTTSQKIVDETSKQTAEYVATFLNNFQAELNKQIIHSFNVNHEKIVKSVKDVGEDNKVDANLILDYLKTNSKEIKSIKETLSNTDFATTGSVEKIFKLIACENEKRAKERNTFTELIDELMKEVRAIEKRHSFGLIRRFWNWIW